MPSMHALTPAAFRSAVLLHKEATKTAIHEAGHTVAAWAMGFRVAWVSTDGEFVRKDPLNERGLACPTAMVVASERLGPIIAKGRFMTNEDRSLFIEYGAEIFAGPYAEYFYEPASYDRNMTAGDAYQFMAVLSIVERRGFERRRLQRTAFSMARQFVEEHWDEIRAFASVLEKKGTLHEDEINRLLSEMLGDRALKKAAQYGLRSRIEASRQLHSVDLSAQACALMS